ncbi:MAG: hypothetical protein ABFS34_11100 [Gemmatimonadota bacterium]
MRVSWLAFGALLFVAACGDSETTDDRQWYTKAPIEEPGLRITAEEPTEMADLGTPDLFGTGAPDEPAEADGQEAEDGEEGDGGQSDR